jgi:hypothetical protein
MNLLHLAPDLQEAILFLPPVLKGRDPIHLEDLQALTAHVDWQSQRRRWNEMQGTSNRKRKQPIHPWLIAIIQPAS